MTRDHQDVKVLYDAYQTKRKQIRDRVLMNIKLHCRQCHQQVGLGGGGGGFFLVINRLMGMLHWMRSRSHDWIDNNGVAFIRVTRMRLWKLMQGGGGVCGARPKREEGQ